MYKYKTSFSSKIRPIISENKDLFLAKASIENLKKLVPDIDIGANFDLLPFATNAYVSGRINKNTDGITNEDTLKIYKTFINKFVDTGHNRNKIVGVILTAGFSEFGTDKPLTEDEVKNLDGPFNVVLGGVIWKSVNSKLADLLEQTNDETSPNYLKISASFEVGFSDYDIILLEEDKRNIKDGKIISGKEKEEYKKYLLSENGEGKKEKTTIARILKDNIIGLGIGLVEHPAADVKGVFVEKEYSNLESISNENKDKIENLSSQTNNNNVNNKEVIMNKIAKISDITDESLKQVSATHVIEFITEELKKASEEFSKEQKEKDTVIENVNLKYATLSSENESVKKELTEIKEKFTKLQSEIDAKNSQETFNQRMASLNEEYELTEDVSKVVASEIKDLNEEQYKAFKEKFSVLYKNNTKKAIAERKDAEAKALEEKKRLEAKASNASSVAQVVDKGIDGIQKDGNSIPNTVTAEVKSLMEKYEKAFSDEILIVPSRKRR